MGNDLNIYRSIVKQRGLNEIPYQRDIVTNPKYNTKSKPIVVAMGTSAGKTLTTILKLEVYYSKKINQNKKTIIFPSTTVVLRDNFETELNKFNPNFSFKIITNKKSLTNKKILDSTQVFVMLPQTGIKMLKMIPKCNILILDEAHQWYFQSTIRKLIKHINPDYQYLLTGSPSIFNSTPTKFVFKYVSVMELYEMGLVSNVKIEVIESLYDFKESSFNSPFGDLKKIRFNKTQTENSLKIILKNILNKNGIKSNINTNQVFEAFEFIGKTIIFCSSITQSNIFFNQLSKIKNLKNKIRISQSESDKDSKGFREFKEDDNILILISVNRGRLGYNLPELFNIIDFTLCRNPDLLMQMYGRLLRKSKSEIEKVYYKISTVGNQEFYTGLMLGVLSLTQIENYSTYSKKTINTNSSVNKIKIPIIKTKSNRKYSKVLLSELILPYNLDLFKTIKLNENDEKFKVSWGTLETFRQNLFGINNFRWNKNLVLKTAKKYTLLKDFRKNHVSAYGHALKNDYLEEVVKHMTLVKPLNRKYNKEFFDKQIQIIKKNKCKTKNQARNLIGGKVFDRMKTEGLIQNLFPNDLRAERGVIQKMDNGKIYKKWKSIADAVRGNGFSSKGGVWGALNKRRGHNRYNGYLWDYMSDELGERKY